MGLAIIIPVLPTLIQELTGESVSKSAEYGGYMLMFFAAAQFLFAPLMGELSDRFGRRPVLLLALTGLGIDYLVHAFAPTITILYISRIVAGIFGSSHTVASAYIADVSTPEDKAKNFGLLGAAFSLGFIVGPFIGGVCAQWGYQVPFIVAACFSFLNVIFGLFVLPESLPKKLRRKVNTTKTLPFVSLIHLGKYKSLLLFVIAFTLTFLAGQVLPSTWAFFTIEAFDWSDKEVGYSLAVVGVLVGTAQGLLVGKSVKRFGSKAVIVAGYLLWTFGMFAFAFASNSYLLYAALVPYALGATASPVIQGIMSNAVPGNEQGNLQGALTSLISLTAVFGPVLFTWIFHKFTAQGAELYFPGASFLVAAGILVISTVIALIALSRMKELFTSKEVLDSPEDEEAISAVGEIDD